MRVFELAAELGIDSKEVLKICRSVGISDEYARNHMANLTPVDQDRVRWYDLDRRLGFRASSGSSIAVVLWRVAMRALPLLERDDATSDAVRKAVVEIADQVEVGLRRASEFSNHVAVAGSFVTPLLAEAQSLFRLADEKGPLVNEVLISLVLALEATAITAPLERGVRSRFEFVPPSHERSSDALSVDLTMSNLFADRYKWNEDHAPDPDLWGPLWHGREPQWWPSPRLDVASARACIGIEATLPAGAESARADSLVADLVAMASKMHHAAGGAGLRFADLQVYEYSESLVPTPGGA